MSKNVITRAEEKRVKEYAVIEAARALKNSLEKDTATRNPFCLDEIQEVCRAVEALDSEEGR